MFTDDKILNLVEVMLTKCENQKVDNLVNLNQYHNDNGSIDYVYEIRIMAGEDDGFLCNQIDYTLTFCFGDDASLPYIMMSYSDTWNENVKVFDKKRIKSLRGRVEEIYKYSRDKQFNEILEKTMDFFDIDESEIRDVKIKNLIENE